MAERLTDDQISEHLQNSEWQREGDEIVRHVELKDFAGAIALTNRIAEVAEQHNHHPDILIHGWNQVKLSLTNHSAGGLTDTDFEVARDFDAVI
jgi:4a-hydroxytetrahydrobiopterin dehydratase